MQLQNQVCSLEQAKRLKELSVSQDSLFHYTINIDPITPFDILQRWQHSSFDECEHYSAYSVAELGVMLPCYYMTAKQKIDDSFGCFKFKGQSNDVDYSVDIKRNDTEAQARASMLIQLLEKELITASDCNERLKNA